MSLNETSQQPTLATVGLYRRVAPNRQNPDGAIPATNEQLDLLADNSEPPTTKKIRPSVPNPAPLGLIGFGFTTALLQVKHTRIGGESKEDQEGVDTWVLGFAIFFGGLLQIIAGISEIRRNNLFGYTAFCIYGGFWMSVGTVIIVRLIATEEIESNSKALQAVLFLLGIVTLGLWTLTFNMNVTISSLFFFLTTTCFLLSFGVEHKTVDKVGGYFGLITSVNALWLAFAELFNDTYGMGEEIIPLGQWNIVKFINAGTPNTRGRVDGSLRGNESDVLSRASENGQAVLSKDFAEAMDV